MPRGPPSLKVHNAIADLLGATLIPELRTDITAGTTGNIELALVAVAAVRALPDELAIILDDLDLSVVAALLAIVALGVELGVHDVVVDVLQQAHNSLEVILHVGNLDVRDGSARREALELALELELREGVDFLADVHVVAVRDVTVVGDARHNAKAAL